MSNQTDNVLEDRAGSPSHSIGQINAERRGETARMDKDALAWISIYQTLVSALHKFQRSLVYLHALQEVFLCL